MRSALYGGKSVEKKKVQQITQYRIRERPFNVKKKMIKKNAEMKSMRKKRSTTHFLAFSEEKITQEQKSNFDNKHITPLYWSNK